MDNAPTEIRGDVLFDRLLGWGTFVLAVLVVIFSLVIPHQEHPAATIGVAFAHYRLLVLTCIGGIALTRISRLGYWVALVAFSVRLLADTADLSVHHGDRFISMSWTFDAAMVAYCIFRIRTKRS